MDEFNNTQENTTEDKREVIKQKLRQYYDGGGKWIIKN